VCHACQLGRHVRLPFHNSVSCATRPFELIHCDLWTSPILSISGSKYYLVCLDDFTHYLWTFPLKLKSDTFSALRHFHAYVLTHFQCRVQSLQCDNGREFDNNVTRSFFQENGIHLRLSCPHTSQQNGKAERVLRSVNNIMCTLLFQSSMPPSFGLNPCAQPPIYLTFDLPKLYKTEPHTKPSSAPHFPMIIFASLGADATQTCQPPCLTNSPLVHLSVSYWAILTTTKAIGVSIYPQTMLSSPGTWSLMRIIFPLLQTHRRL
jgi:hypothetical protein